ncbi:hypothetical protein MTO96_052164, partial [Rhipicephalus appendiculatus]
MAEFAYRSKKRHIRGSLIFFITQARYKVVAGTEYQLGFIVFINDALKEKCIVKMLIPPNWNPWEESDPVKKNAPDKVFEKEHMATRKAVILLMGLLLSFCDDSFGASGWTEVRNPDTYTNRALAEFAYGEKKRYRSGGLTFLVTQARHKYDRGTEYQLGFIAYQNGV